MYLPSTAMSGDKSIHPTMKRVYQATGATPTALALAINESSQNVNNWANRGISKNGAIKIAVKYKLNLDWILTGIESQQSQSQTQIQAKDGQPFTDIKMKGIEFWDGETPLDDDEFEVPYYKDIELTGGAGSFDQYDDGRRKIKYGKTAARKSGASQTASICMTLVGDSMEDLIRAGSMIAIDASKTEIREGKIYAFRHGHLLRVKYLIPRPDGGLIIRSHNPAYEDETVSAEEAEHSIKLIGWVWNWSVLERW